MQKLAAIFINALVTALVDKIAKPLYDSILIAIKKKKMKDEAKKKVKAVREATNEADADSAVDDL